MLFGCSERPSRAPARRSGPLRGETRGSTSCRTASQVAVPLQSTLSRSPRGLAACRRCLRPPPARVRTPQGGCRAPCRTWSERQLRGPALDTFPSRPALRACRSSLPRPGLPPSMEGKGDRTAAGGRTINPTPSRSVRRARPGPATEGRNRESSHRRAQPMS